MPAVAQNRNSNSDIDDKMPKRKRAEDELEDKLAHHSTELFRRLKEAKGLERQRMAKRQRGRDSTREQKAKVEKEIVVLKVGIAL